MYKVVVKNLFLSLCHPLSALAWLPNWPSLKYTSLSDFLVLVFYIYH